VIGHEFTHSIDRNGAKYDKNGTLTDWSTDADYTAFTAKTQAQTLLSYNNNIHYSLPYKSI